MGLKKYLAQCQVSCTVEIDVTDDDDADFSSSESESGKRCRRRPRKRAAKKERGADVHLVCDPFFSGRKTVSALNTYILWELGWLLQGRYRLTLTCDVEEAKLRCRYHALGGPSLKIHELEFDLYMDAGNCCMMMELVKQTLRSEEDVKHIHDAAVRNESVDQARLSGGFSPAGPTPVYSLAGEMDSAGDRAQVQARDTQDRPSTQLAVSRVAKSALRLLESPRLTRRNKPTEATGNIPASRACSNTKPSGPPNVDTRNSNGLNAVKRRYADTSQGESGNRELPAKRRRGVR